MNKQDTRFWTQMAKLSEATLYTMYLANQKFNCYSDEDLKKQLDTLIEDERRLSNIEL